MLPGKAIYTPTIKDFKKLVLYCLDVLDLVWFDESIDIEIGRYNCFREETCIRIGKRINYARYNFYRIDHNMKIVSIDDFFDSLEYKKILKKFK